MYSKRYVAIIGDIIGSRQLPDRGQIQLRLEKFLNHINVRFSKFVVAKFVITIGDEFQGLVTRKFPLQEFLWLLKQEFGEELKIRFGIGLGALSTALREEAIGMDGACFHHARSALNQAKEMGKFVFFAGFEMNYALMVLFDFVHEIEVNWTSRQWDVIKFYYRDRDQLAVAEKMDVSKQAINKIIKTARFDLYYSGWVGIMQLFSHRKNVQSDFDISQPNQVD